MEIETGFFCPRDSPLTLPAAEICFLRPPTQKHVINLSYSLPKTLHQKKTIFPLSSLSSSHAQFTVARYYFLRNMFALSNCVCPVSYSSKRKQQYQLWGNTFLKKAMNFGYCKLQFRLALVASNVEEIEKIETNEEEKPWFRWGEIGPDITEAQKEAISRLPPKMTNRCKTLLKQIICFSPEKTSLSLLLAAWVRNTIPRRADWLSVLKELSILNHPLYFEVAELALLEDSFEPNVRDYTKIIHAYAKQNRLQDAENTFLEMKKRGFTSDQVTLTSLIHMYSKAGNLKLAEDTFEEMKLPGQPLDKRSYGSMVMAYIRAGMFDQGESLLREMDAQQIYAGREVYKALLRAYSMIGDCKGAQRIFGAIQLAGITPDIKLCGLLINAYVVAGLSREVSIAFENLRRGGLKPNDKCVALILTAYHQENKLNKALNFLVDLERDGIMLEKEASDILVGWFRSLGVVEEVELVLRDYVSNEAKTKAPPA